MRGIYMNLSKLFNVAIAGAVIYGLYRVAEMELSRTEKKSAEYTKYEMDGHTVTDYGSLELPVSYQYGLLGRAAGQVGGDRYGSELSMVVGGIGQNYQGRAFGL